METRKKNTIEIGDEFSERVISILSAAGFQGVTGETRDAHKKTDASSIYLKNTYDGVVSFRFEMKNYKSTLSKEVCQEFVTEYFSLIDQGKIDRAWLISNGNISPDGRELIKGYRKRGLMCFTINELYRHILDLDMYLSALVQEYENSKLSSFYISPKDDGDGDLEAMVRDWMLAEGAAKPMAIIGSYGQGKSTFARYLAASLAQEAIKDRSRRIPILITLGDLVEEQRIDGLISSLLASRHSVFNYHYDVFKELNKAGAFLIIYDGLDEMKHGMIPRTFQKNLENLLELDAGNSRILLLGRDTVAHTDEEFRSIIDGYQSTKSGQLVPSLRGKLIDRKSIRGFTLSEAHHFVRRYFRVLVEGSNFSDQWIDARIEELTDKAFDKLIVRPVHAQMLCRIATDERQRLSDISLFELYDRFIHYLIDREVSKVGRYPGFDVGVRRHFNSAFAWWLWERGQSTTTTLADIPDEICRSSVSGVDHDFSNEALRRELSQGCLVHKAESTLYFGHRSIQEFLVAEYLYDTDLLYNSEALSPDISRVYPYLTEVIRDFILEWVGRDADKNEKIKKWMEAIEKWKPGSVRLDNIRFFVELFNMFEKLDSRLAGQFLSSPWGIVIFSVRKTNSVLLDKFDDDLIRNLRSIVRGVQNSFRAKCSAISVMLCILKNTMEKSVAETILDSIIISSELKKVMDDFRFESGEGLIVNKDNYPILWMFLRCAKVVRRYKEESYITVDFDKIDEIVKEETGIHLVPAEEKGTSIDVYFKDIYSRMARNGVQEMEIERVRRFLNNPAEMKKLKPVEVQVIKSVKRKEIWSSHLIDFN